jgi:RsiW-degrading membrane proteinase PrsW (M82 family)
MHVAFYVTLLIVTTLIWGYVFYKKDYHPQPLKVVVKSFAIGLFAMVPIFGYKYLYQKFLPMLAEYQIFRPLLESPLLSGIAFFVFNLTLLSILLFILSGIVSVLLNFFNYNALINLKNALKEEPLGFAMVSILLGAIIYLETLAQNVLYIPIVGTVLGSILFLAIIEEYIKHLMVRVTDDKKIEDIDDAITLSIMVGLAFAFIETVIYCIIVGAVDIIFFRTMISIPIHIVASGIFGYYYGLAHFAKPIVKLEGGEKTYGGKLLPKILSLKRSTVYREEKIIEGTFFATIFHAAANMLFEFSLGFLAVPFIVIGLTIIFHLYKVGAVESKLILSKFKFLARIKARLLKKPA